MHQVTHPTKEQVRAYMLQRKAEHRPPPAPDQIRRELGWSCCAVASGTGAGAGAWFFPMTIAQLNTLLAIEWLFYAGGFGRPN